MRRAPLRACEEGDSSSSGAHANRPARFFADAVLLDAAALVAHAVPVMERVAREGPRAFAG
jgi:hypothetical protein